VGTTLVPLDAAKVWALSDWPVHSIAFNPLLSQYMSDEKRERQTPSLRVLGHSMVHSFPELGLGIGGNGDGRGFSAYHSDFGGENGNFTDFAANKVDFDRYHHRLFCVGTGR
jgi:hypothetical protein